MIAEAAAWAAHQGKTLFDLLTWIYTRFGCYTENLLSLTRKGKAGAEEIRQLMIRYREHPLESINGIRVCRIKDYLTSENKDLTTGMISPIPLPKSNVLQFILEDGSVISVRPSGTEPKIKYYFSVTEPLSAQDQYGKIQALLQEKINGIIRSLDLH
jgi:phosphoglucomutase